MKKYWILLITLAVMYLAAAYQTEKEQALGLELLEDAYYGRLTDVKDDLEHGAPLNYVAEISDEERQYNSVFFNAFQAAASSGNEDLILFLLDQGFDINSPTSQGWTPLFIAVRDGQTEAAKLLIYRGADLNAQTNRGATALTMAVTQKFPSEKAQRELIIYLLKRGADPTLKDRFQLTPPEYAQKLGRHDLAELFRTDPARL